MPVKQLLTAFGNGALNSFNYLIPAIFAGLMDKAEENAMFGTIQTFAFVWILSPAFVVQRVAKQESQNPDNQELDGAALKIGYYLCLLPSALASILFATPLQKILLDKTSIKNSTEVYHLSATYFAMGLLQANNFLLTNAAYAKKQYRLVWTANSVSLIANLIVNGCFYAAARPSVLGLGLGLSAAGLTQHLIYLSAMSRILLPQESKKFFSRITWQQMYTHASRYKDAISISISLLLDTALNYWLARILNDNKASTMLKALNILLPLKTLLLLLPIEYIQLLFQDIEPHPRRVFTYASFAAIGTGALFLLTTIPGFFLDYYGATRREYNDCVVYLTASIILDADAFEKRQMLYGLKKVTRTPTIITFGIYLAATIMMAFEPIKDNSNLLLLTMTIAYLLRDIAFNAMLHTLGGCSLFFSKADRQRVRRGISPSQEDILPPSGDTFQTTVPISTINTPEPFLS